MDFKFLFSDNGTLTDYSAELSNYHSSNAVLPVVAAEDAMYIGVRYPLNSFYLKVGVANDAASVMSVSYWDGSTFRSMVETIDETSVNGVTLAQSGHVTFVPDKNHGMRSEDTQKSNGSENIAGLGAVNIYDRYWYKLSFSVDLNALTALSFVGNLFNSDDDLTGLYPGIMDSDILARWETGKTSWEEQSVIAGKALIADLISSKVITSGNQILRREKFMMASCYKTVEIIFTPLGEDYAEDKKTAIDNYRAAKSLDIYDVDQNNNAILETKETAVRTGVLSR